MFLKKLLTPIMLGSLISFGLTGCATTALVNKDTGSYKQTTTKTLVEDKVLAFGQPTTPLANMPKDVVVIVGQQHSYVLYEGATDFVSLISQLDPRFIQVSENLSFFSEKNDGHFKGKLNFKYSKLKEDFNKAEKQFFLQYNVRECTSSSDERMQAQSFCFSIPLAGAVYPAVKNQASVKALSKAYPITIYTKEEEVKYRSGNVAEKIILLPFAVAFDVVTLPFQALEKIFD